MVQAKLKWVQERKDEYINTINSVDEYMVLIMKPKMLDPNNSRNELIKNKIDFESLCIILMKNGIPEPDKMSIMRFYSAIKVFEKTKK